MSKCIHCGHDEPVYCKVCFDITARHDYENRLASIQLSEIMRGVAKTLREQADRLENWNLQFGERGERIYERHGADLHLIRVASALTENGLEPVLKLLMMISDELWGPSTEAPIEKPKGLF